MDNWCTCCPLFCVLIFIFLALSVSSECAMWIDFIKYWWLTLHLHDLMTERRCCSAASVCFTCCSWYRSGPCMDNKRHVRFTPFLFFSFMLVFQKATFCFVVVSHLIYRIPPKDSVLFIPCRFLKAIDRFNDLVVSVYVTAGHILTNYGLISKLHATSVCYFLFPCYI